jgi:NADPH-dependent glutamate synthase beta subunit-like oxidoreductase
MDACNRIELDGAVNVRELERYVGDHGQVTPEPLAERDERIAVVGSGPAGLTAAYHLARFGYRVTVFESGPEVGGLLRTGIPDFRLPEDIVSREIDRILDLGVRVETNHEINRQALLELAQDHDAALVATGLQEQRDLRLGMDGAETVVQGIDFLDHVHQKDVRVDGEDVLVIGGGNTAMDAARSALRLGAESVRVVYRRTREEMPAIGEEIDEALEEGVAIELLTQPVALHEVPGDGVRRHHRLTCRRMQLGEPDESGRRAPIEISDSDFDLTCHRVILALGQSPDLSVFPEGTEVREGTQLLGLLETPVFAIGDLATRDGTVAAAIGSGRRTAVHIHYVLSGEQVRISEHAEALRDVDVWRDEVIHADALKLHLFERQPASEGESLAASERRSTFDEVHMGLEDTSEAARCLSCGVCNECDFCCTYCPEGVLKRVGHRLEFDYSFCKGCGVPAQRHFHEPSLTGTESDDACTGCYWKPRRWLRFERRRRGQSHSQGRRVRHLSNHPADRDRGIRGQIPVQQRACRAGGKRTQRDGRVDGRVNERCAVFYSKLVKWPGLHGRKHYGRRLLPASDCDGRR